MAVRRRARAAKLRTNRGPTNWRAAKIARSLGDVDFSHRILTNSMRTTDLECSRKAAFEYGHGLAVRGLVDYFWVGGVAHDEWERMYKRGKFLRKTFRKRLAAETRTALDQCVNDSQREAVWRGNAVLGGMIPTYAWHYLDRDMDEFEVVGTETKWKPIPIPGTLWRYAGMRDMLVRDRETGELGLWENKTAGQVDSGYVARLPLDFQILGYCWATMKEIGEAPRFVLYNVVKKSLLRQRHSQGETPGQLLDRIEADYREDPTKYFYRERLRFDRNALKRFERDLVEYANDLEDRIQRRYFPQNTRACTNHGRCAFMPLCIEGATDLTVGMYRKKGTPHEELA